MWLQDEYVLFLEFFRCALVQQTPFIVFGAVCRWYTVCNHPCAKDCCFVVFKYYCLILKRANLYYILAINGQRHTNEIRFNWNNCNDSTITSACVVTCTITITVVSSTSKAISSIALFDVIISPNSSCFAWLIQNQFKAINYVNNNNCNSWKLTNIIGITHNRWILKIFGHILESTQLQSLMALLLSHVQIDKPHSLKQR